MGDFGEKSEKIQNIDKFCIKMAKNDIFVIKIHSSYEESRIEANCWTKKENKFFLHQRWGALTKIFQETFKIGLKI